VVRNGYHAERTVTTAAGPVPVKTPRVNDKRIGPDTRERHRFASAILPAWARKTSKVSEVLPLLYLHGLSTGDFVPALEQFLGSAAELSSATVSRLTAQWQADHDTFTRRDLSSCDYMYVWADGVHLKVRLEEAKACVLVLLGIRADVCRELITLDSGYRESGESWANLLRDAARRGMRAPILAVGDGALGFWKALREIFPDTREQRRWVHKAANILDALPKSAESAAKTALAEIWNAEDREHAEASLAAFAKQCGAKSPNAAANLTDDEQELLAFYAYPAEHWIHVRTTNPIEPTFSTVRLRSKVTRGAGSRTAALAMTFKLIESAQER
jgi:putative transposase